MPRAGQSSLARATIVFAGELSPLHGVEKKVEGPVEGRLVFLYQRGYGVVTGLSGRLSSPISQRAWSVGEAAARRPDGVLGGPAKKIVLNLERLFQPPPDQVGPLARLRAGDREPERGDYNNKVLALIRPRGPQVRVDHLRPLTCPRPELTERLIEWVGAGVRRLQHRPRRSTGGRRTGGRRTGAPPTEPEPDQEGGRPRRGWPAFPHGGRLAPRPSPAGRYQGGRRRGPGSARAAGRGAAAPGAPGPARR